MAAVACGCGSWNMAIRLSRPAVSVQQPSRKRLSRWCQSRQVCSGLVFHMNDSVSPIRYGLTSRYRRPSATACRVEYGAKPVTRLQPLPVQRQANVSIAVANASAARILDP